MKKVLSYLMTVALLVTACEGGEEPGGTDDGYTDIAYDSGECGVQPMTGIALRTDNQNCENGNYGTQLEYALIRFSDVCSQKDIYDWSCVDAILFKAAWRKRQVILRFYYSYPGEPSAVPDYIKQLPDYGESHEMIEQKEVLFPDWRSEELQRFHIDFYRRLAERYDSDPRVAFIEVGLGFWSEYQLHLRLGGHTYPSEAFYEEWLTEMEDSFQETPWCLSIESCLYTPLGKSSMRYLMDYRFGIYDDSILCEAFDSYNAKYWTRFGKDRYKRAPAGGEFCYCIEDDLQHGLDKEGIQGRTFESAVKQYHLSFLIGDEQPKYQSQARIIEASKAMGYRFQLTRFAYKEGESVLMTIKNIGVAPIYQDAFPAVDGVRSIFNLRSLMPGDSATFTIATPSASATSVPSVWCERLVDGQQIDLVSR